MFNSTIGVGTQKPNPRKLKGQSAELLDAAGKPKGSILFGEPVKNAEYGKVPFSIEQWDRPVFVACHSKSLQNIRCKDIGDCLDDDSLPPSSDEKTLIIPSNHEALHPYEGTASGRPVYIVFFVPKEEGVLPRFEGSCSKRYIPGQQEVEFISIFSGSLNWA